MNGFTLVGLCYVCKQYKRCNHAANTPQARCKHVAITLQSNLRDAMRNNSSIDLSNTTTEDTHTADTRASGASTPSTAVERFAQLTTLLAEKHSLTHKEWCTLYTLHANYQAAAASGMFDPAFEHALAAHFDRAKKTRDALYGRTVFLRGLLEVSNYCKNDCYYCGIRAHNTNITRYRLSLDEILKSCALGYSLGYRTFVLQGGEDPRFPYCDVVATLHKAYPDCAITVSAGELSRVEYQALYDAGARRYLLRHETANEYHYHQLHPQEMSLENRKHCLYTLRDIGFQVGSGFLVGAPFETPDTWAENMEFLHELDPHMIGIGPFIPHKDTPFASCASGSVEATLFTLACLRLAHPSALLPATTALATLAPQGRIRALDAGANVIMPNISPQTHRHDYALYDHKLASGLEAIESHQALVTELELHGYHTLVTRGDSLVPIKPC